jgi:hypothetical protein
VQFFICHENKIDESLYWGYYNSSDSELLESIKSDFDKNGTYYQKFFDTEIQLFNFNEQVTFNLISKEKRTDIINEIVDEIKVTLKTINK